MRELAPASKCRQADTLPGVGAYSSDIAKSLFTRTLKEGLIPAFYSFFAAIPLKAFPDFDNQ
jgi:hypothetical protein